MGWWYGGGPSFGMFTVGFFIFLLFWVLVTVAIVIVVIFATRGGRRQFQGHPGQRPFVGPAGPPPWPGGPGGPGGPGWMSPEQILASRFASGEIDEKEYRERMAVLRAESGPAGAPGPGSGEPS